MARISLDTYRKKRDFSRTAEPSGRVGKKSAAGPGTRFVVHEHHASRLHFDLRLEMAGVLKSWAVPKGPSLDPKVRRLAVQTEDHPLQYLDFQGSIADGQYGAGEMRIWDSGTYALTKGGDPLAAWKAGRLHVDFSGGELAGSFMLMRTARDDRQWLLFKLKDEEAVADWTPTPILPYGSRSEKPQDLEPGVPAEETSATKPAAKKTTKRTVKSTVKRLSEAVTDKTAEAKAAKAARPARCAAAAPSPAGPDGWPPGAVPAKLPAFAEPMLATLGDAPFDDEDWVFEMKWDGWRALLRADAGRSSLISRNRKSLDAMFPELGSLAAGFRAKSFLADGEVVALDAEGRSRFQLLQGRLKGKRRPDGEGRIVYYVFDLLCCDGMDLRACPLAERKALLKRILIESDSLRYSEHSGTRGREAFAKANRLGFEGVVAKRKAGPYAAGRSTDWVKIKGKKRQEVVIAGMTEPRRSRHRFGSLVAGLYRDGELVFAGHVGGGFDRRSLEEVHALLAPLATRVAPFRDPPKTNEPVTWVKPVAVAEVEFAEWTDDGRMRQPVFLGLRPDKDPKACVREREQSSRALKAEAEAAAAPAPASGPALTHLEKVYWPGEGRTKGDLIRYYDAVAPWLLPHLKDRPIILKRFPDGIGRAPFYQHDIKNPPSFLRTVQVREKGGRVIRYALCQDRNSLLYLANQGVIPMHPWLSRTSDLSRPDFAVFDLDPQDVPFDEVRKQALFLGGLLDRLGIISFPKTSGSRGIHVYVPFRAPCSFAQSLGFAQRVAEWAVRERPDAFTTERSLKTRGRGRIYLDCMQNAEGKSVAAVYSAREKAGAPVSAALEWSEIKRKLDMADFNIDTMPARLRKRGDLFAGTLTGGNSMAAAMKRRKALMGE